LAEAAAGKTGPGARGDAGYEEFCRTVADSTTDAAVEIDDCGAILFANRALMAILGYRHDDLAKGRVDAIVPVTSRALFNGTITGYIERCRKGDGQPRGLFAIDALHVDGHTVPLEVSVICRGPADVPRLLLMMRDISHRDRVREAANTYSALSETTTDAIVQINEGLEIIFANTAVQTVFGYRGDEILQASFGVLFPRSAFQRYSDHFRKYFFVDDAHRKASNLNNVVELLGCRKDGDVFQLEISFGNSRNILGERILTCILRDITERKRTERRLRFLAYHDKLTELGNRDLLYMTLKQYLSEAARYPGNRGALMFLDLDGFKRVNDGLGHEAGDTILREAARRISGSLRESDIVYRFSDEGQAAAGVVEELFRFGGDEFVILLNRVGSSTDAARVAQRILDAVAAPYEVPRDQSTARASLGVSIGIALIPDNGGDAMTLIRSADVAMYKAKETRNSYVFFTDEINRQANQRIELEAGIREAIDNNRFVLYYQPLADATGVVRGAEALIRWIDPDKGPVSPGVFIPIAEETGLILPIGDWALETACRQLQAWNAAGFPDLYVSVNLSVKQFNQPDLVERTTAIIRRSGVKSENLRIEITESSLVTDPDDASEKMHAIKKENPGIKIAIDDFGAGYSSLSYLSELPVDMLKIDQSFVMNLFTQRQNPKIVSAVIALAESLHMDLVAEGVESEAQLHFLATKGCRIFQGYYFGKPMPGPDLERRLEG
jgi:PAS domain S-box-containing protein